MSDLTDPKGSELAPPLVFAPSPQFACSCRDGFPPRKRRWRTANNADAERRTSFGAVHDGHASPARHSSLGRKQTSEYEAVAVNGWAAPIGRVLEWSTFLDVKLSRELQI